jgi:hypothetical protein
MQSAFLVTGCLGEEGGGIATLDLNGFDTVTWRFLKHDQGAYPSDSLSQGLRTPI